MRTGEDVDNCVVFDSVNNLIKVRARDGATGSSCRTFAIAGASEVVKPAAVTMSVNGSPTSASRKVTFSCETSGVVIHYTTGSTAEGTAEPTASSSVAQNNQITITADPNSESSTVYVRAVAVKNGEVGDATTVANALAVTTARHCATPTITVGDDLYITITSTSGATIKYTLDGSNPASSETAATYDSSNKPQLEAPSTTIKAYATLGNYQPSDVATKTQNIAKYGYGGDTLTTSTIDNLVNAATGGATAKKIDSEPKGNYVVAPSAGSWLWICVPSEMSISKVSLNGFLETPMNAPISLDNGFKCYRKTEKEAATAGTNTYIVEQ